MPGLVKPGKPPLLKRVAFLLSTNRNERNYKIGRYLEGRKAGKAIPGTKRPRKGFYGGVYATGVNKAGADMDSMDPIDALDAEIEKAVSFRGVRMSPSQRRAVALGGKRRADVWRERGLIQVRVGGARGQRRGVRGHQAKTTPSRTQRAIAARLRKSEAEMDCIEALDEAIEKANWTLRHGITAGKRYSSTHGPAQEALRDNLKRLGAGRRTSRANDAVLDDHTRASKLVSYLERRRGRSRK